MVGRPVALSTATVRSWRVGRLMRAVNRIGWPTITRPEVEVRRRAKTTTRPDISSSRRRRSVARNISRPWPTDIALSVGVTVTGAACRMPRRSGGDRPRRHATRSRTRTPRPRHRSPPGRRRSPAAAGLAAPSRATTAARRDAPPARRSTAPTHPADRPQDPGRGDHPAGQRGRHQTHIQARRRVRRPGCRTGVRHGPGRAACPAAPGRCRRHRRAGRRW